MLTNRHLVSWEKLIEVQMAEQQRTGLHLMWDLNVILGSTSRDMGSAGCVLVKDCESDDQHRQFEVELFQK
jgi:hypothetical protein